MNLSAFFFFLTTIAPPTPHNQNNRKPSYQDIRKDGGAIPTSQGPQTSQTFGTWKRDHRLWAVRLWLPHWTCQLASAGEQGGFLNEKTGTVSTVGNSGLSDWG